MKKTSPKHSRPRPARGCADALSSALMIYGRHPVLEALRRRPKEVRGLLVLDRLELQAGDQALVELFDLARYHRVEVQRVASDVLARQVMDAPHQGVVAELAPFSYTDFDQLLATITPQALVVALDHIQDPHNLGALARSALALGASAIIIPKDRSAQVTPAAFKASAGALAHIPVSRVVNLARALTQLASAGLQVVGTLPTAHMGPAAIDWRLGSVLVVGNEQHGLRPLTAARCQLHVRIPIETIGSLNASVAGAICLYEARRQRTRAS